jgi:hypothetical protein
MKSIFIFYAGLFVSGLILTGCTSKITGSTEALFAKCWTHAFEEDGQDGIMIFRPCHTHTFPAARYRHTFTLQENGDAEFSILASNDAHTTGQGKWTYDPASKKLKISDKENGTVAVYEVKEIKEDLLRLTE